MVCYRKGKLLCEGKTKAVYAVQNDPNLVWLEAKDDITAGDGAKHDILSDKGALATETTCNVFRLLKAHNLPLAFHHRLGKRSFMAMQCDMLPYEVVVRREAHGSYLKRYPEVTKGQRFDPLVLEFFLKTTNKYWHGRRLPADDPLIVLDKEDCQLYIPNVPMAGQTPFWSIVGYPIRHEEMGEIACRAFSVLELAWQRQGRRLVDFKVEFGIDYKNRLLLADVIDNDSWRVVEDEVYIDKQVYRDGGGLDQVLASYRKVAELSKGFCSFAQT